MLDEHRPAVLRGFDTAVADIGDQLHLCQPLLSFEGDPTLYFARRLDWQDDRKALAVADPSEASELGTLLPDTHRRTIASGEAVVAVGAGFVRAVKAAGVQFDGAEMDFAMVGNAECRIGVATPARFANLKTRLADEARTAFDDELGDAALHGRRLSGRGNAALLLLRRCGPRRRDDLAIRQLAGARQNRELDIYRRLLIRFALELHTREDDLDKRAERHVALAAAPLRYATSAPEYDWIQPVIFSKTSPVRDYLPDHKGSTSKFLPVIAWEMKLDQHRPAPSNFSLSLNTRFNAAVKERNPRDEMCLDSGDFGEVIRSIIEPSLLNKAQPHDALFKSISYSLLSWDSSIKRMLKHSAENRPDLALKTPPFGDATRLLHKSKNLLLPRSNQERIPRKSIIPAKFGIQRPSIKWFILTSSELEPRPVSAKKTRALRSRRAHGLIFYATDRASSVNTAKHREAT